jgi:protein-arginine deiminase
MRSVRRFSLAASLVAAPGLLLTMFGGGAEPEGQLLQAEQKGPQGTVVLLNNCDASDAPDDDRTRPTEFVDHSKYAPDNLVCSINGPEDFKQLEPITVRRFRATGPVSLRLVNDTVGDPVKAVKKVRVFLAEGAAGAPANGIPKVRAILGPSTGTDCADDLSDKYTLSRDEVERLAGGDLRLYAEGLQFAVTARLQLFDGDTRRGDLVLQVAPFLLLPHTQPPVRNLVVQDQGEAASAAYVRDFRQLCTEAREKSKDGHAGAGFPGLDQLEVQVLPVGTAGTVHGDVWIEDELQWGATQTPRCSMPVALHMNRIQWHHNYPGLDRLVRGLIGPGIGYFMAFNYPETTSLDYGGDLEVTPPTEEWPFGRVYYGSVRGRQAAADSAGRPSPDGTHFCEGRQISLGFQEFFKRQKRHPSDARALQEPLDLFTDWLGVGHVDEIVSFVPVTRDSAHPHGFVLLWASPAKAIQLLEKVPPPKQTDARYLIEPRYLDAGLHGTQYLRYALAHHTGHDARSGYASDYGHQSVEEMLEAKERWGGEFLGSDLRGYNERVDKVVRANVDVFQKELKLIDTEIVPMPVLLANESKNTWAALALTPGLVNLSSMGRTSLMPRPFIPAFEDYIKATLEPLGQEPVFIDDWERYHLQAGEVHCGSNMRRQPFARKWWEESARGRDPAEAPGEK